MSQVYDMCVPQGFQAAVTYSGICDSRVKLDTAMIVSPSASTIVCSDETGLHSKTASVLLLHHGLSLPQGVRGSEIQTEICQAAAACLKKQASDVALLAAGAADGYFRPSLLVHSLNNLQADLADTLAPLTSVLDNAGDAKSSSLSFASGQEWAALAGFAAKDLALFLTDAKVSPQVLTKALNQVKQNLHLGGTLIVMASGAGKKSSCTSEDLVKALQTLFSRMGVAAYEKNENGIA